MFTATLTNKYTDKIKGYKTKILDTQNHAAVPQIRKAGSPHWRRLQPSQDLYDMIMPKDNHIDFCGGIEQAIQKTNEYLAANNRNLKIEIETRNLDDVRRVLAVGNIHRIMLDNCSPELLEEAIELIGGKYETEASGGINLDNIISYARTGVDYVSCGAITNQAVSMDLSLIGNIHCSYSCLGFILMALIDNL